MEIEAINSLLCHGDKKIIAEVAGVSYSTVMKTFNKAMKGESTNQKVIMIAKIIAKRRQKEIDNINEKTI